MNLRVNDNNIDRVTSTTVNGLNITVLLESGAVNTSVPETGYQDLLGFDPSNINVQVDLKRNGSIINILNTNLALLAVDAVKLKGGHMWFQGLPVQAPAVDKTHIVKRSVFIYFHGHINIKDSDELVVNCTLNRSAFGSAINPNTSIIQVEVNESIGIEYALNQLNIYPITAELANDKTTLGDNVLEVLLHSFEKDWKKGVFRQVNLTSDRLDWTANEQQLNLRHWEKFPFEVADILFNATANDRHPLRFPNSYIIHTKDEIDKAALSFTLNPTNVQATQNYVMYWTYQSSREIVQKALTMKAKHEQQGADKLPLTVN